MTKDTPELLAAGTSFVPDQITHWARRGERTLDEALAEADVVVSCPSSAGAIPAELAGRLRPGLTGLEQAATADVTAGAVARRWAELDRTVVCVLNPHPPLGPLLRTPATDAEAEELARLLHDVAARGAGVYDATRDDLLSRLLEGRSATRPVTALTLATVAGADSGLPGVATLANRGDAAGNPRPEDPFTTMDPERFRMLADSLRTGFRVGGHDEIALNVPDVPQDEADVTARRFSREAGGLDTVLAAFRREYVHGSALDDDRLDEVARRLQRSWAHYRTTLG